MYNNLVIIVMVPVIIGSHLAWSALQNDTRLVPPEQKRGQPLFTIMVLRLGRLLPRKPGNI
ncbi:hypothetical protein Bhyg_10691 [Pseudolycoriella hygida]|uniref:Uncharacterized protein n=1 Tax=Pseudolycoriella hygida TaxID=35572 RepID=A0A9Q0MU03_9DIPT|nr:hypothetical protein Bhyg_10691 [Pseudolycoriella hygida]